MADPTEVRGPLCQPASAHRWEIRKRKLLKKWAHNTTYRCLLCPKVIQVTTKPVKVAAFLKPPKYCEIKKQRRRPQT